MRLPKYLVQKFNTPNGMMWGVFVKGKLQSGSQSFDKSDAEDYAQRCVEDDAWNASNR